MKFRNGILAAIAIVVVLVGAVVIINEADEGPLEDAVEDINDAADDIGDEIKDNASKIR